MDKKYLKYKFKYLQEKKKYSMLQHAHMGGMNKEVEEHEHEHVQVKAREQESLDITEVWYKDEEGIIHNKIFKKEQEEDAVIFLSKFSDSNNIVLDLHGVLSSIDSDVKLHPKLICCSYVGRSTDKSTDTRFSVRNDFNERFNSGQIKLGVAVFVRPIRHIIDYDKYNKAWVCSIVTPYLFIDDAPDHCNSVHKLNTQIHVWLVASDKPDVIHSGGSGLRF
jgi:hypothetical protein